MIGPVPWWAAAVILAGELAAVGVLAAFAGYVLGHRHGREDDPRLADLAPVPLDYDGPPLAPLDPADPVDRMILDARLSGP